MKTIHSTFLISLLMFLSFYSLKATENPDEQNQSQNPAWRFGNVKSWDVSITIYGASVNRRTDGSYDSSTISSELTGTIEDIVPISGRHYMWPLNLNKGGLDAPDGIRTGSNLKTKKISYKTVSHVPAIGTIPEEHIVCISNLGKTVAGLGVTPHQSNNVYEIYIGMLAKDAKCTSEDIPGDQLFQVELKDLPMGAGNELKGSKTITKDEITYKVSWRFTPATYD